MNTQRNLRAGQLCLTALLLAGSGCAHMSHAGSGTLFGATAGTIAGAAIGHHNGDTGAGAIIGGLAGAVAGNVVGTSQDAVEERDRALAQRDAAILQASAAQAQPAMTNFDLMRLSQNGVSEEVIVNMVQTRGGNFDVSPNAVITLKNNDVSDRVILAAQAAPGPQQGAPNVMVVEPPPAPVYVEPAPIIVAPYPPWYHHHHHWHRRPRSGAVFHIDF